MKGSNSRIFKNKWFARFARKESITDADLCAAISNIEKGLIEADLGGGVVLSSDADRLADHYGLDTRSRFSVAAITSPRRPRCRLSADIPAGNWRCAIGASSRTG